MAVGIFSRVFFIILAAVVGRFFATIFIHFLLFFFANFRAALSKFVKTNKVAQGTWRYLIRREHSRDF